jgi:glycosyltransferase involved in cell wall biosynthesis
MFISVIMASHLSDRMPGATNKPKKFIRAVKSFINQTHQDKELIIVSDGCDITTKLYEENFKELDNIKFLYIPKQEPYSSTMRNVGLKISSGDIVCYLDADDVIGKKHLEIINEQFDIDKYEFVYYDDWMVTDREFKNLFFREVYPRFGSIGTSSISHVNPNNTNNINGKKIQWVSSGYGHDFLYVLKMISTGCRFNKLKNPPNYIVCHARGIDF